MQPEGSVVVDGDVTSVKGIVIKGLGVIVRGVWVGSREAVNVGSCACCVDAGEGAAQANRIVLRIKHNLEKYRDLLSIIRVGIIFHKGCPQIVKNDYPLPMLVSRDQISVPFV
jgi:hypothetical protein